MSVSISTVYRLVASGQLGHIGLTPRTLRIPVKPLLPYGNRSRTDPQRSSALRHRVPTAWPPASLSVAARNYPRASPGTRAGAQAEKRSARTHLGRKPEVLLAEVIQGMAIDKNRTAITGSN